MKIRVTHHAIVRYWERVVPHKSREAAKEELERLAAMAPTPSAQGPGRAEDHESELFTELAPGIWLAVEREGHEFAAVTCLTNAGLSEWTRARRNRAKAERKKRRRKNKEGARYAERGDQWAKRAIPELEG